MKKEKRQTKNAHQSVANQRLSTAALNHPRSVRQLGLDVLTSMNPGLCVPIGVAGLLREDAVRRGRVQYSFEMHETAEILMNAVQVEVSAYFVPFLAFERFMSMDELNRSYRGEVAREGDDPIPFIETIPFDREDQFNVSLGLHAQDENQINTAYLEAYNEIFNFRARNRSKELELRDKYDATLAPAFWNHQNYELIVNDFDQAKIDGEVALNIVNSKMPVKGIGKLNDTWAGSVTVKESDGNSATYATSTVVDNQYENYRMYIKESDEYVGFPDIFAELQDNGISVSLSNIELAKKTQAFAKMREKMQGYEGDVDEYIIDLLMQGIQVPEQAYKQPMLLAKKRNVFGFNKRYASDAGNLDQAAVNGVTMVDLNINLPRMTTGGVIMIIAEIVPEQLWERQQDPFLHATQVSDLPNALVDELDPEKVEFVPNSFVDVDHDDGSDNFGFAPLNFKWNAPLRRIGGRFYRPEVDASFDEDRQRLWAVETENPTLSEDFYLATQIHNKVFSDQTQDSFEVQGVGGLLVEGNTVFGHRLFEGSNDYQKVLDQAPMERIEKDA